MATAAEPELDIDFGDIKNGEWKVKVPYARDKFVQFQIVVNHIGEFEVCVDGKYKDFFFTFEKAREFCLKTLDHIACGEAV